MSYIVRNCPALRFPLKENPICSKMPFDECCKDITDCVMKRIMDECNNVKQKAKDYSTNAYSGGMYNEANRILELLEIEEIDD